MPVKDWAKDCILSDKGEKDKGRWCTWGVQTGTKQIARGKRRSVYGNRYAVRNNSCHHNDNRYWWSPTHETETETIYIDPPPESMSNKRKSSRMLQANIIRPSNSCWSFLILLVPKKDGGKRFCVDFRKLNKITKNYVWPMPHLNYIVASFGNSTVFGSLDLKSGYWQVPVDEKNKEKTAFACHAGLFEDTMK